MCSLHVNCRHTIHLRVVFLSFFQLQTRHRPLRGPMAEVACSRLWWRVVRTKQYAELPPAISRPASPARRQQHLVNPRQKRPTVILQLLSETEILSQYLPLAKMGKIALETTGNRTNFSCTLISPINLRGHTPKDSNKIVPRRCQIQLTRSNLRMIFLSMFQHGLSRWVAFATKWALKGTTFVVHYIHMPYVVSTHCECLVA